MAFTLFAQNGYDGAGYYRIKNRGEAGRYISIENDKVSEESKKISFAGGKSVSANIEALRTVKNQDYNPGTIIYVSGGTSGLTLEAQGMNTDELLQKFGYSGYKLKMSGQGELNTTYSGYQIDLIDFGYDTPVNRPEFCAVATLNFISTNSIKSYALWDFKKIDNEKEYFAINPDIMIQVSQNEYKYYTTLFTSFAYQVSDGMKAYYIDQHNYDTKHIKEPIAELKEIPDGKVPAATPVIIKCSSSNIADNKVTLLTETLSPITGNELKGRIFSFVPTKNEDQGMMNALEFNKNSMRVIGFVDGELSLVNEANSTYSNSSALISYSSSAEPSKKYIPANKVYLPISSSDAEVTANGIKLLLPDAYAVAASITKVMSEDNAVKEGIYTLTGVKVKDDNNTNNLPRGIYIINGKKQVIR